MYVYIYMYMYIYMYIYIYVYIYIALLYNPTLLLPFRIYRQVSMYVLDMAQGFIDR
jgi:hypothetical protein